MLLNKKLAAITTTNYEECEIFIFSYSPGMTAKVLTYNTSGSNLLASNFSCAFPRDPASIKSTVLPVAITTTL